MAKRSAKSKKAGAAVALREIYQIKVSLMDIDPPVWRRILVPGSIRLDAFHTVLQIVMGWTDTHLHGFIDGDMHYGIPDGDSPDDEKDERRYRLNQLMKQGKKSIIYEYDFGDGWEHRIVLEKILPFDGKMEVPQCLDGQRACPPEDCGGPPGYEDFLDAITDPSNPEHDSMLDWVGGEFDPELFDLKEVNELLKKYCR